MFLTEEAALYNKVGSTHGGARDPERHGWTAADHPQSRCAVAAAVPPAARLRKGQYRQLLASVKVSTASCSPPQRSVPPAARLRQGQYRQLLASDKTSTVSCSPPPRPVPPAARLRQGQYRQLLAFAKVSVVALLTQQCHAASDRWMRVFSSSSV